MGDATAHERPLLRAVIVASLLASVPACGTETVIGPMESDPEVVVETPVTPSDAARWNPADWEPTVTIEPEDLDDDDRMAWREDWLARMAETFEIPDPPDVELVRWTSGATDTWETIASCMTEAGFAAKATLNGVEYVNGIPPEQVPEGDLAWYTCHAQYTRDPVLALEWTEDQIGLIFDYWNEYFIPCMEAHGHPIDVSARPSREEYVTAYLADQRSSWRPPASFNRLPADEQERLALVCTPLPPDDVLYGLT